MVPPVPREKLFFLRAPSFPNKLLLPRDQYFDAVVHLAGENVAGGYWTPRRKERIRASRITGTRTLVEAIKSLEKKPKVLLCASAVGYYGDAGERELTEASPRGTGFLAELCRDWEAEANRAAELGIRVVNLRFGVVLSPRGGALQKMLPAFRFGLGGPLGDGRQFISWISLRDTVRAIAFLMTKPEIEGPVNLTAPNPVRNNELTRALAKALHRPAFLRVPAPILRLLLGELAREMLLCSQRVLPALLLKHHFSFQDPEILSALQSCLK